MNGLNPFTLNVYSFMEQTDCYGPQTGRPRDIERASEVEAEAATARVEVGGKSASRPKAQPPGHTSAALAHHND